MAISFLNSINLNQNELIKARIENQPNNTAAGTGVEGQLYYDTTLDVVKVWANGSWVEVGGGVISVTTANSTFVSLANSGTAADPILTASLSATGTPSSSTFLRGDNTWAATPNQYTGWSLEGDSGIVENVDSGDTVNIVGSGVMSTDVTSPDTLSITHLNVARTNTTSTASPAAGATFTAVDTITSSAEGHITGVNLKTVTLPSNPTITLTGEVTGSGTTIIATTVANNVLDVANFNATAIVTAAEGIENNNNDTTLPTSAAVKAYVDAATVGGLVYQGGYNAATNTPNLDVTPIAGIKKGWTYTVTADGLFFTEQVRVGDVLIAEIDSPTTLADWTTVQNNIDIASASQIGIGNVAAGTGVSVSYASGTATVTNTDLGSSQNIFKNVAVSGQTTIAADTNNDTLTLAAGSNISITTNATTDTVTISNTYVAPTVSYADTITNTDTITHGLSTRDVIIQLYDTVTFETVYADVDRISTAAATVTFATAPTNPIRVLVQKIG
jgi:hypothetical protein